MHDLLCRYAAESANGASPAAGALSGVTRDSVLDLAREQGIPCEETLLTRYDLYTADECFMTGTGAEIVPVIRVDRRQIGTGTPGAMTHQLRQAFAKLCRHDGVRALPGVA